jgi:hypothetical protein
VSVAKPVRLRQLAAADLDAASENDRQEAGEQTALDFINAVESGIRRISRGPHVGADAALAALDECSGIGRVGSSG